MMQAEPELIRVTEFAARIAQRIGLPESAARQRIYNRIRDGKINAKKVLGSLVIDTDEAERILQGEVINEP